MNEEEHFLSNGRIVTDGEKMIMFDDCKDGMCNIAIEFEPEFAHSSYLGRDESEWMAWLERNFDYTDNLRTAKLEDFDFEDKIKDREGLEASHIVDMFAKRKIEDEIV